MPYKRRIVLEEANNFRDLGGYPAAGGHTTAWGKLFRTELLRYLSASDWEKLHALGISTLIDLRSVPESKDRPVNPPDGFTYWIMPFINWQSFQSTEQKKDESMKLSLEERYPILYERSAENIAMGLSAILDGLSSGSVAFFCTAGKDRTGMMAASVLFLLGVSDEDIVADYMMTEVYNADRERGVYRRLAQDVPEKLSKEEKRPKYSAEMLASKPEIMHSFVRYLHELDLPTFLDAHGFPLRSQDALRSCMLDEDGMQ